MLTKPIRAELGGVGPTIVLPGPWTDADIEYQAQHLATQKLHNAGHTCVASQVLILPGRMGQDRRPARRCFASSHHRTGTAVVLPRHGGEAAAFRAENPSAEALPGAQTRTLLGGVDPDSDHPGFTRRVLRPDLLTTANYPAGTPAEYLRNAVEFANERLHGNLGANLIVHPDTLKELGPEFDRALEDLHYGAIGVNAWSAFVFLAARGAWGAYPGNTPEDIQSGTGVVHNALLFDSAGEERGPSTLPALPEIGAPRPFHDRGEAALVPDEPHGHRDRPTVDPFRRRPQTAAPHRPVCLRPARMTPEERHIMHTYDYVIVGSGSAGSVLAGRLTEDPDVSVCLIEAGGSDRNLNVKIPAAFPKLFKSDRDWAYFSDPEPGLLGRRLYMPRGKMIGGSSSMNAMLYVRGNRADYDGWAKDGADGWSYDEVLPYFRKSEDFSRGADAYRATGGPLHVGDHRSRTKITELMVEAAAGGRVRLHRRLQRRAAGGRLLPAGQPAQRQSVVGRRRVAAPGSKAQEPDDSHRGPRSAGGCGRRSCDWCARRHRWRKSGRACFTRGDPLRRCHRDATTAHVVRDRSGGAPSGDRASR